MRLRLKTKLVLAISAMVFALVTTLSSIFVAQLLQSRINAEAQQGEQQAQEIVHSAQDALQVDLSSTRVDTENPAAVNAAVAEVLQSDAGVNSVMESVVGYSPVVYDAAIIDANRVALLHTNPNEVGQKQEPRPEFDSLRRGGIRRQIEFVYGKAQVLDISVPLARESKPFGAVRIGINTIFLKHELKPIVDRALIFSGISILVSLILAAALSSFALRPLETISRQLDALAIASPEPESEPPRSRDEVGMVTAKIDRLGRQVRDVKEVFSALKENLDQIMSTLQDGLMLFTRDWRTVLVSASAENFIGQPRGDLLGRSAGEIFSTEDRLGRTVLNALEGHKPLLLEEVETETGHRLQVSLDFIEEGGERMGALLTMRDAESVRRIESEIELSRRLAAIGQLTRGVAHEVKNPINAIVVHLEILRNKLKQVEPDTKRHVDVIGNEIQRLDRVVQMLVDFTRPVELRLAETDLRRLVEDVVLLASPDAERHGVHIDRDVPPEPIVLKIDADLVKQALLNVALNGIQAMPDGGRLTIVAARNASGAQLTVHDEGSGIPPEIRSKVFDLYFTTKQAGSGIGLAMTFRVMQLHNGSIDFESTPGMGTTFRLKFPQREAQADELQEAAREGGAA
jgi:signal transduction histidine kinase